MNKILYSVFGIVVLLSITSCSKSEEETGFVTPVDTSNVSILATAESPAATRTALQDDGNGAFNVVWSKNDRLTLQGKTSTQTWPPVDYVLQDGEGTTVGQFVPVTDALNWSLYSTVDAYYAVANMKWPAEQKYLGEDIISNAPMYCSVNNQYDVPSLSFKNMGGILRLKLKGYSAIKRIEITSPDKAICGAISEISSLGTAKIDASGGKTITMMMDENVRLTPEGKVFNVAMPSGDYSGLQIKVVFFDDNILVKTLKSDKSMIIRRAQITNASFSADYHYSVDLGLPSGIKWATCNIGAGSPEDYGDYFAWGEAVPCYTEGHSQDNPCESWKTGKTGYNKSSYENNTVLGDVAAVNWGGSWRMPTKAEQDELRDNCTCEWTILNGVNGLKATGPNGNSIFLPAAGFRRNRVLLEVGSNGYYWSSSSIYHLYFDSARYGWGGYDDSFLGRSVRAVCP